MKLTLSIIILLFLILPLPIIEAQDASVPLTPSISQTYQTDLMSGSAAVSVPIVVAPGRQGVQPSLALQYSSSSGNGICGAGWSLELGAIQRNIKHGVPKYDAGDTYTANIGGAAMELVCVGGSEYRAKQEGAFIKFTFDGTSWQARDKSGTTYLLGTSASSRQAESGRVFKWCIDKVSDRHGNYMSITYLQEQNEIYPQEIQYTGKGTSVSPIHSVTFNYETRTDVISSYRGGFEARAASRLASIDIRTQGNLVRKYALGYTYSGQTGRSLLTSVTTYGQDGVSALPPVTFEYQSGSVID